MTAEELRKIINAGMEDEATPARVLKWVEANQGKLLRSNNLPEGFHIRQIAGMTQIEDANYRREGAEGFNFLVDWKVKHVMIPAPDVWQERSPSNYRGLQGRNAQRRRMLEDGERLALIARTINKFQDALMSVEGYLDPFTFPDAYSVARAAGFELGKLSNLRRLDK